MASPFIAAFAAAVVSLGASAAMACPDLAACGGMSRHYGYYTEQASFGPLADSAYDQAAGPEGYGDEGYGPEAYGDQDQGGDYGSADQGPPPYDPRYDQGASIHGQGGYDRGYQDQRGGPPPAYDRGYQRQGGAYRQSYQGGQAYESRGYETSSRSSRASVSEYGYDSGWQRAPTPEGRTHGGRAYGGVSVAESEYDSGWQVRQGRARTVVLCPPGSAYQRPDPRYGCPLAAGNSEPVPTSFFYDQGGVGPDFVGGGGGGGGGGAVIVGGGARAGGFAFASAHASASASAHVGGHFGRGGHGGHGGHGGGHGCGCGGHH